MSQESKPSLNVSSVDSQSRVAQTANIGRSTSVTSGAAKVFREFKWGLLTLFLLMVVVVGLVYDGGRKKKMETDPAKAVPSADLAALDSGPDAGVLPLPSDGLATPPPAPGPALGYSPGLGTPHNDLASAPSLPPVAPTAPSLPAYDRSLAPATPAMTPVAAVPSAPSAPAAPAALAAPAAASDLKTYTVKPGDTLSSIASTMLPGKGGLKAILDANKDVLPNPNKLRVGTSLKIPATIAQPVVAARATDAAIKTEGAKPEAPKPAVGASEYVVQNGDTLERIARKLFKDGRKWKEIYEWNRDQLADPSRLRAGQTLRIKQLASAEAEVPVEDSAPRAEILEPTRSSPKATPEATAVTAESQPIEEPQLRVMSSSASFP